MLGSLTGQIDPEPVNANEVEPNNSIFDANDIWGSFTRVSSNSYYAEIRGTATFFREPDYYRFFASPGDTVSLRRFAVPSGQNGHSVSILDRNGSFIRDADNNLSKKAGGSFSSSVTLNHTFRDDAYAGDYYIVPHDFRTSRRGDYTVRVLLTTDNRILEPDRDNYTFEAQEGDKLTITTRTPGDHDGAPVNELDPALELFDTNGSLVATSDNDAADGRNARIIYEIPTGETGTYTVRVSRADGSEEGSVGGDYELIVADGSQTALEVTGTTPLDGDHLTAFPAAYRVELSQAVNSATVDASDLLINGAPATGVTVLDHSTLEFDIAALAGSDGVYNVNIADDAFASIGGALSTGLTATFTLDTLHPTIASTNIAQDEVVPAGAVVFQATLSEPLDTAGLGIEDVTLVEHITGVTFSPDSFAYDVDTLTVEAAFDNLGMGEYTITLTSGADAFRDLAGLGLDGTGAGTAAVDFDLDFLVDVETSAYPSTLDAKPPAGSLIYDPAILGAFHAAGDTDSFTLDLDAGQKLTAVLTPRDASIEASIEVMDPANQSIGVATAAAAGNTVLIQNIEVSTAGTYTIEIGSLAGTGLFDLQIILGASFETETADGQPNDTLPTAQDIEGSSLGLPNGADRLAVLGQLGPGNDLYTFQANAGEYLSLALASHAGGNATFDDATIQDISDSLNIVRSADLNGDGLADVVVGSEHGRIVVWLSNGDGTFTESDRHTDTNGKDIYGLVIANVDSDPELDVVAVSQVSGGQFKVEVLSGNGDGTLDAPVEVFTASGESDDHRVVIGNFDGVNGLDIAVADQTDQSITVLLQQANGSFNAQPTIDIGADINDLAVGDIDADGDLDLVVGTGDTSDYGGYGGAFTAAATTDDENTIQVLLGFGDGTFDTPTSHIVADPSIALVVGDFDGDGDDDIASAGSPARGYYGSGEISNSVSVLLSRGDGSLAPAVHYQLAQFVTDLQTGDIDGDGDTDLIAIGDGEYNRNSPARFTMSTLLGHGDGTFQTRIDTVLPDNPGRLALGDINGDGALDAVANNDNQHLMVLLGRGAMSVELLNDNGDLIALGDQSNGSTNSRIADFLIDTTATYYARVHGVGGADYSLVVARDAAIDHEINDAQATAQDISPTGVVLGHLDTQGETSRGQSGAIRVAVHDLDRFVSIASQLDDDTFFDFDVYAVTATDIDTIEELNQYDVVVLNDGTNFRNEGQLFGSALRQWVEAGGGLITTGNVWTFPDDEPAESDFDAVVPTDVAGFTDFTNRVDVTVLDPNHPITIGIPDFNTEDLESDSFLNVSKDKVVDPGAVSLIEDDDGNSHLIAGEFGQGGRSVWMAFDLFNMEVPGGTLDRLQEQAVAWAAGAAVDQYTFDVFGGENLIIRTETPGDGPDEPINTLDPRIEVYNHLGFLVGSDDNNGPGENAVVVHTVPAAANGTYRVVVHPVSGAGDYTLAVEGVTPSPGPAPFVVNSTPTDNQHLAASPTAIDIVLSEAVRPDSVDATDLIIDNGATVTSVEQLDGRTIRFSVDVPDVAGTYTYTLAADSLTDLQGQTNLEHTGGFELDRTGPRIIDQTPASQAAEPFNEITFTFNEELAPGSFTEDSIISFTSPTNSNLSFTITEITGTGNEWTVKFTDRTDFGLYTMVLDASAIFDVAGNAMDQDENGTGGELTDDYTATVTIQSMDLDVESVSLAAGDATFGGDIDVSWTVRNLGGDPATEGWIDRVWLSADSVLNEDEDTLLLELPADDIPPLGASQAYMRNTAVTLPLTNDLTPGTYQIIVQTDATNTQPELNENNNTDLTPVNLTLPPLPDLVVSDITAPAQMFSNQDVDITWTLTNQGGADLTGSWTDFVFLSDDDTVGDDQFFGSFNFSGTIAAGGSINRTQTISVPFNITGNHFVVVQTDVNNTVFEHDADNNNTTIDDTPIDITQSPFPNLQVTSVTHNQTEVDLGDKFQVDWVVENVGTAATSASFWRDRVYLSVDDQLDGTDIQIGDTFNTSFLNAGENYGNSTIVTATGVSAGEYFILVKTDARNPDQVEEFIAEGDNVTAGPKIIVVLPPPPDLMVLSTAAGLGVPPTGFSGQLTPVNYHVANTGPGLRSAVNWFDDIYISDNEFFDNDDSFIGRVFRRHVDSVDANNRVDYTVSTQARLPVGIEGDFFIFVLTDSTNRVNEFAFENNNFNTVGAPIHVNLTPPPDLEVVTVDAPDTADAGFAFTVDYTVANNGATRTPNTTWFDSFYLSSDDQLNPGEDTFLGSRRVSFPANIFIPTPGGLDVGDSYTRQASLTTSNTLTGDFFLFVVTDRPDDVFELDNVNNVGLDATPITIQQKHADFVVSSITGDTTAEANGSLNIQWTVTNQGTGSNIKTSWNDAIIASVNDTLFDADDRLIAFVPRSGRIQPGDSLNRSINVPVPSDFSGTYNFFIRTDVHFSVFETDDTNNTTDPPLSVDIIRNTADLVTTPTLLQPENGRVLVEWDVNNNGNGETNSTYWRDVIYASVNDVFGDDDDVEIESLYHSGKLTHLPTGYSVSKVIDIPFNLSGPLHFFVATDIQSSGRRRRCRSQQRRARRTA